MNSSKNKDTFKGLTQLERLYFGNNQIREINEGKFCNEAKLIY